jgi:hypothetical protein
MTHRTRQLALVAHPAVVEAVVRHRDAHEAAALGGVSTALRRAATGLRDV